LDCIYGIFITLDQHRSKRTGGIIKFTINHIYTLALNTNQMPIFGYGNAVIL